MRAGDIVQDTRTATSSHHTTGALMMLALVGMALSCVPPDCDRPDFGTCGNACCSLLVHFPNTSSVALMQ